jgi:hypothetical protein
MNHSILRLTKTMFVFAVGINFGAYDSDRVVKRRFVDYSV